MYGPIKHYDALLADIKRQISRIKSEIAPEVAPELGAEIQQHLNRVLADVADSAFVPEEDRDWSLQN